MRLRQRDTTSVVSSVNSNVTRALTVRKLSKPQRKRRQTTSSFNESSEQAPQEQPGFSWSQARKVNDHNFTVFQKRKFHQQVCSHHPVLQKQRKERPRRQF